MQAGTSALSVERGVIENAIASRGAVDISYHSISRDEVSHRTIYPLEFTTSRENEYVFAFCESSKGYRTFKLDRIVQAKSASVSEEISPEVAYANEGKKFPINVNFGARLRDVVERFNLDATAHSANLTSIIEVESFNADWAIREIMSFGGEIGLESPRELRRSLQERSLRALSAYQA